jgi:type I restriction-modification system DNA methylase subunit
MAAPEKIIKLIERFGMFYDQLHSPDYNETELRNEYVNPFFEILGWDVINKRGYSQAYREVIHEAKIKRDDSTKHPDYAFRIGRETKFFVETKKPAVNINKNPNPALQLRSYIWTSKLPLGILTDFEEFAVYDGRFKPIKSDKASTARILYVKYNEYPEKWDKIESIFAKESILKGSFDEYAEKTKTKKGTTEVDDEFLKEISRWREILARNIALRNKKLSTRELNWVVQKTIDRIIFLRITEDREIEEEFQLQKIAEGKNVYQRLRRIFLSADDKYNSGLFHFRKEPDREGMHDELSLNLSIDDNILKDITKNLYYPDSPYAFAVMPADILGQVYEQFLGKVIRLTPSHQAKVEYKPEVKKAGGVYYTPTYIVDYIVKNTLGKILKDKNPDEVSKIKILDPACGSGSFLIVAYQLLLDWHLEWYSNNNPEKLAKGKNPRIYLSGSGDWMLATVEKKRILLNNIHGVDIDPQAVEVTKLSLLLKVLENENKESIGKQLSFFHRRALPDLGNNIKCGNSLIGSDFYSYNSTSSSYNLFTEEEQYRINAFDWDKEFPQVFVNKPSDAFGATSLDKGGKPSVVSESKPSDAFGATSLDKGGKTSVVSLNKGDVERSETEGSSGFDVIIGNPPYVRIQTMKEWAPKEVEFYKKKYISGSKGNYDIYVLFAEKGLQLLNEKGRMGFILPHKFFQAKYGKGLRKIITDGRNLSHIVHFGDKQVFSNATTYTCLLFLDKQRKEKFSYVKVHDIGEWQRIDRQLKQSVDNEEAGIPVNSGLQPSVIEEGIVDSSSLTEKEWNIVIGPGKELFEKLSNMPVKLGDVAKIFQGLVTGADGVFKLEKPTNIEKELLRPLLRSAQIEPYSYQIGSGCMLFPYDIVKNKAVLIPSLKLKQKYPNTWSYLKKHEKTLKERERGKWYHDNWYAFGRSQNLTEMEEPKLIIQVLSLEPRWIYDDKGLYMTGGGGGPFYGLRPYTDNMNIKYLLGILNSRLSGYIVSIQSTQMRGGYYRYSKQYLEPLPIRTIDFSNPADVKKHDRMVSLVDQMLDVQKKIAGAKTEHEKKMLVRMRDTIDKQIDELVYELYELTDEEIKIVEG